MSRLSTIFSLLASWLICVYARPHDIGGTLSSSAQSGITRVCCPSQSLLRNSGTHASSNQKLNPAEKKYIENRRKKVVAKAYQKYLENVQRSLDAISGSQATGHVSSKNSLPDYVAKVFTSKDLDVLPRTALALSGGGYRAALYSAGILNSFDGRNATSEKVGTGGLLQACDYVAGLSGGSWVAIAMAQANFPMINDLALGKAHVGKDEASSFGSLLMQYDLFSPASNKTSIDQEQAEKLNVEFTAGVIKKMSDKLKSGFHVTMADFWSLVLRYHIVNGTTEENFFDQSVPHGLDITFSGIQKVSSFQKYEQPFPIITMLPLSPGQDDSKVLSGAKVPVSNTAYECTPLEIGSWDVALASFLPTQYLGTRLRAGKPEAADGCIQGFDRASYLASISSDVFPTLNTSNAYFFNESPFSKLTALINSSFSSYQPGISIDTASVPNPFLGIGTNSYLDKNSTELRLLDGGLDGAATPYLPLLIPARKLDLIIGSDGSSDTTSNYPNGASLQATFARAQLDAGAYSFPKIPSDLTKYQEMRAHPIFFGCDNPASPLILWLPNSPPLDGSAAITNTSSLQTQYERFQVSNILSAASEIGYRGFPSEIQVESGQFRDPLWPACLACAVADRSRERQNIIREGICSQCFERYCWPSSTSSPK